MIEETIYQALKSLAEGNVYLSVAPLGAVPPYLIYSVPTKRRADVLTGQSESYLSIQIDAYDLTLMSVTYLIEEALRHLKYLAPTDISEFSVYESETNLHRRTAEFRVIQ
ncbi:DUF3168 domain-containing protein [Pragia fontium]|uniref:DUF3168 domain-containing protein n=1 Tax=Pragia fontium TaxID=82985 RepID=UPI00064A85E2|nr:DUF3168 domain-containing protein [Pragia fontium]AKJ41552.1 hypothetical protein QQ39_05205 [Pragia fontium]